MGWLTRYNKFVVACFGAAGVTAAVILGGHVDGAGVGAISAAWAGAIAVLAAPNTPAPPAAAG